jgi:HD-like signal output (HDOD) protein
VARLIEDDPAIMTRILKVVNSPLYSGTVEIESVSQAVTRLGMTAINNLALSTSVFSAFAADAAPVFDRQAFWRHSISVGIATCVIHARVAPQLNQRHSKENLRLVGLLHDIGKIVMEQHLQVDFQIAVRDAQLRPMPLFEAEHEHVGADHALIGAWLAVKWGLSDDLVQTILWHHDPSSVSQVYWEQTVMCHIANYICNQQKIGDGGDLAAPVLAQMLWKKLGLSVADISSIVDEINEESKKSDILLALA